jgi:carbon-monoxide dehydrogenase large subunit
MSGIGAGGAAARWVGQPVRRREDPRLLAGHGRYVDDVTLPGMLHAAFVRSPVARGTIRGIDTSAAQALAGVVAVFTAADLNEPGRPFWKTMIGPVGGPPHRLLAEDDVRFTGDVVALVVAETRYLAEDGAELVDVDIDPLPPVLDPASAAVKGDEAGGAPLVHPELGTNVADELPEMPRPDVDEVFASAAHVITETFEQHRYLPVPMETRGLVASWDRWSDRLELVISGQGVHEVRLFYSRYFGIPEDRIRVVMGDVGGSFGQKVFPVNDEIAVVAAARRLGRPVKWIEDRHENLVAGGHARDQSMRVSFALDADGTVLAARTHLVENVGAFPGSGSGSMLLAAMVVFTGPYRIGAYAGTGQAFYTNTCSRCAYRGPWMIETTAREQMMDVAAAELGIDPLELRRRNVIQPGDLPFTTALGITYDKISPAQTLEQAAELIGYDEFRAFQQRARAEGRLVGIGMSVYIEPLGAPGILATEAATIRIEPSGTVNVLMGTGSHGQSLETTIIQVVADHLGAALDDVHLIQGDTAVTPYGPGTAGSRSASIASGAAVQASVSMRERVLAIAAAMLEANPADLTMADSRISVAGDPDTGLPLKEVAAAAYLNPASLPPGTPAGLEVSERYQAPMINFSNAAHACTVEVDPATGVVRILRYVVSEDCGTMINPMVVEGQIAGGVVQGIGGVFYEHMIYDPEGNPLPTTFLDYLLPTAAEVPELEYGHVVTPGPTPGGYKGMGEGGAIASPAALANAVRDALAPLGARVTAQPLTPDRVLGLIEKLT